MAALNASIYLTGKYDALAVPGDQSDQQTSVVYDANTGEIWVDAPVGKEPLYDFSADVAQIFVSVWF